MANVDGTKYILMGADWNVLGSEDTEADAKIRADQIMTDYPVGYWIVILSGPARIKES